MKSLVKHVAIPSLAPVALIALYFTPKEVFGCANRGYMALGVVLLATIAAFITTIRGAVAARRRRDKEPGLWLLSTLILLSAVFLLFGPLR